MRTTWSHAALRRRSGRLLAAALTATLALGSPGVGAEEHPPRPRPPWPADAVPGSLLVTGDAPAEFDSALQRAEEDDGTQPLEVERLSGRLAKVQVTPGREAATAAALADLEGVRAVEADRYRTFSAQPDDPWYARQWAHARTAIESAWDHTQGQPSVTVAVIDSGVRGDHADLYENMVEQVDASTGTIIQRPLGVDNDTCGVGHGTAVAGVLGAVGDNSTGTAGAAWDVGVVDIATTSTRAGGSCEAVPDSAVLAAMWYAIERDAGAVDVINLSLSSSQGYCPEAYDMVVRAARRRGTVVVAAAGNTGRDTVNIPAACPGVIAVGASTADGGVASYSATNPWVDLHAPGGTPTQGLLTTAHDGGIREVAGTSFAAGYVSGVIALVRSMTGAADPGEVEGVLESSANPLEGPRGERWLAVNAGRALHLLAQGYEPPAPAPEPFFPVLRRRAAPQAGTQRLAEGANDATTQSVLGSRLLFRDGGAVHAILARNDEYADALAGTSLTYGVAPLLFTPRDHLAPVVDGELRRVLPPGGTVYLLGGEQALSADVADAVARLGYKLVRLAGSTREGTAAVIADATRARGAELGFQPQPFAILATRNDWPDAVTGGSIAAAFGIPVLLTQPEQLPMETAAALSSLGPEHLYVIGGERAVSEPVVAAAQAAAGGADAFRFSGESRAQTAVAVAQLMHQLTPGTASPVTVAANIRRPDAAMHALSGAALAGAYSGVFLPVEAPDGSLLPDPAQALARGRGGAGVVIGGEAFVEPRVLELLEQLLRS